MCEMSRVRLCWWLFCVYCKFFFFKQKTAYEMRISDGSSDVCSSDLTIFGKRDLPLVVAARHAVDLADRLVAFVDEQQSVLGQIFEQCGRRLTRQEIGRASCRERVCQYV